MDNFGSEAKHTPTISVVMSIFKEPVEWMRMAIDSILQQTFSDFEFIIINDCPGRVENSKILEEYQKKDQRIVVINNDENVGLTKSLNKGLSVAQGKYIARMDADDISKPIRFERQYSFCETHPEIIALGTSVNIIDFGGKKKGSMHHDTDPVVLRSISVFESPIYHPTSFIRRIIDGAPFYYDEHFKQAQDYALWAKLISNHDIANIDEILLDYRITSQNVSNKKRKNQNLYAIEVQDSLYNNLHIVISDYDKNILSGIFKNEALRYTNEEIIKAIVRLKNNNRGLRNLKINKTIDYLILLYCNYLPSYYKIFESLKCFMSVVIKTRQFNLYNLLSLLNKYRIIGII